MNQALISSTKVTVVLLAMIVISIFFATFIWFWIDVEPVRNPYLHIEDLPPTQTHTVRNMNRALARPLFWQGRQQVSAPEEIVTEVNMTPVSPLISVKLLGIILKDDVRTALLQVEDKIISAQKGQVIQDWILVQVTAQEIVFLAGAEQTRLSLVRKRPASIKLEVVK